VTGASARERPAAILARQLANPLIAVLLASGTIALALGDALDSAVVFGVIAVNTLIGFVQERRAGRAIEALDAMVPDAATVLRDGAPDRVPAAAVVPGDVLELAAGDRVAADARILRARRLEADESPLTGESLPVAKSAAAVDPAAPVAERSSMVHAGTLVASGRATALVVATGARTQLGHVAGLVARRATTTPLTRRLDVFARRLSLAIVGLAVAIAGVALARGYGALDATLAAMALAVAAIPEGLPAIVSIALAVGVRRMAGRRAVVRRLPAVETLGGTTVICTDKTGTLTWNELRVTALWQPGDGVRRAPGPDAPELLRAGCLCNDAGDVAPADPTDAALLHAAVDAGLEPERERAERPRIDSIPFDGARKFMLTLHADCPGVPVAYMKGAPERVLERCGSQPAAERELADLAGQGMRVLALARSRPAAGTRSAEAALAGPWELLGLVAMDDPPRADAIAAVARCRDAGIGVTMITGDHLATARAVGRRFGLGGPGLSGAELDGMERAETAAAARAGAVFARVTPEHKLRLVEALQDAGEIVAMTGDGVNDAPALRRADIGVAMGASGTAAARQASDIVLTDDDFASIAAAVEEGRHVYDNIQKAIAFVLPTNVGEALVILIAVLVFPFRGGEPLLPVQPTQILWVNLIATVTLALPLALEAREPGLMRRRPRTPAEPLLTPLLVTRTLIVALAMTAAALIVFALARADALGAGLAGAVAQERGQTAAVTAIVLFQAVYLLECRSLVRSLFASRAGGNPWVWAGIAAVVALQCAFVYAPPLQELFGSRPLDAAGWALAALAAASAIPVVELDKRLRARRGGRARG
jgi:calcium-translocating P-type ATPase